MSTLTARTVRPRPAHHPLDGGVGHGWLAMPFDALRFQYAGAVMAGLVPRSILASAKSERSIDRLERLILGPMARQR